MSATSPRSSQERVWLVGGALVALVVTMLAWLFAIAPQRDATADVESQTGTVHSQNAELQTRIKSLWSQSRRMSDVNASLDAAQHALPSTSGIPDFLRTLQSLGNQTGADVVNLGVGNPTDVTAVANQVPSASPSSSATPSATPSTAPAPASGGTGVYALPITAQVNGSPDQLDRFLDKLQRIQPRAVLITLLTEGSGDGTSQTGTGTSLQLTMQAFVAPSSASENTQLANATGG